MASANGARLLSEHVSGTVRRCNLEVYKANLEPFSASYPSAQSDLQSAE